ncbi:MAG TPA: AAA family ATPase, partial [Gammaproteobacteria bacterium]|nr:AAA family ATPase [Gammaproteobacteria bacterium]
PYSVILLDEVEKAHPDVFNILLQVLDDGRLTDSQGRTVDFRNTVVVMTSNLGSDRIQELSGDKKYAEMRKAVLEIVSRHFRPEFLNRIDEVVVFHPLSETQLQSIAKIQIHLLSQRLAEKDFGLELTQGALDYLIATGYDPIYGARPLKRAIQQHVENPLAQDLLAGKFMPGDRIQVEAKDNHLIFAVHGKISSSLADEN